MTEKTPDPIEIIELVDVIDFRYVALAIIAGIVVGAIVVYFVVDTTPEDRRHA